MPAIPRPDKPNIAAAYNSVMNPTPGPPFTLPDLLIAKGVRKLAVVTAYDAPSALLADRAGLDIILVGDSLGMVVQGHADPLPVTLEEMIYHCRCVSRAVGRAMVVGDLPFGSYQISPAQAAESAIRLVKEGRVRAVKLEGGVRSAAAIHALTSQDIPVIGHVGLTPQSVHRLGGFKVQRDRERLIEDALAVQEAGASAVVVECVPSDYAAEVTTRLRIPTIGIGAGLECDGQVLVWHDLLGLGSGKTPKFVKRYLDGAGLFSEALRQYVTEVRDGQYPATEHEYR